MAGKKLKNKEADKTAAEAAVKEAVKEKSEVMVLPEKMVETPKAVRQMLR